jgi:hypothetical protein
MRENLKNISGKDFLAFYVVFTFIGISLKNLSLGATGTLILYIIFLVSILYITYYRWIRLKLGNILFVFFCIANLIVAINGGKTYDDAMDYWINNADSSYVTVTLSALSPFMNYFVLIMTAILVFKNAKVKSKTLSDDKSIDTNKEFKLDDESQDNSSLSIEDAKKKLIVLKEYLDLGIITQDEFDEKAKPLKKILLDD